MSDKIVMVGVVVTESCSLIAAARPGRHVFDTKVKATRKGGFRINKIELVEAVGVEPTSETTASREPSCFFLFDWSRAARLERTKKRVAPARSISSAAYEQNALDQPTVRRPRPAHGRSQTEDGYLVRLSSKRELRFGTYSFGRDYGCTHPGMPLCHKQSRRSRDAPNLG